MEIDGWIRKKDRKMSFFLFLNLIKSQVVDFMVAWGAGSENYDCFVLIELH